VLFGGRNAPQGGDDAARDRRRHVGSAGVCAIKTVTRLSRQSHPVSVLLRQSRMAGAMPPKEVKMQREAVGATSDQ